ncbi:DsbA family protein [Cohnella herbarum]|uniref:DsbA family protein n=1 Tax=Cohnella herbarum TaxID=2728023 RepID=A0A7Z2VHF2_9BACL|nr:DsbA family protein [Cohnella herbarum]QJD82980.1 DsbA family protein [Cohnella herbarum]
MSGKNKKAGTTGRKKNPGKAMVLYTTALVLLLVALFFINQANKDGTQDLTRVDVQPSIADQPVIGSEDAKVTLIEFGDYKCPSCKKWSQDVYPVLKAEYIDTGKMKLAFVNTLFHGDESELGALAGEAVFSQNKDAFWVFNEAMFNAQPSANHDGLWITEEKIAELATTITPQIDIEKLKNDLSNRTTLPQVQVDNALVEKYRINQTPTLMINGITIANPFDIESIKSVIDKELGV